MSEYEKGSLGWLREKAKEHGFGDNIREFAKWAKWEGMLKNDSEIYRKHLAEKLKNAGCNTKEEYDDKYAQKLGFKDRNQYRKNFSIDKYKLNDSKKEKYVNTLGWLREKAEEHGFGDNVREFSKWAIENGILNSPSNARDKYYQEKGFKNRQDYEDYSAKILGFENERERYRLYKRDWQRQNILNKGITEPAEFNEECSIHLGIKIGEEIFKTLLEKVMFEHVKWNGGFMDGGTDFVCKNPRQEFVDKYRHLKLEKDKEYHIQLRLRCTDRESYSCSRWIFTIDRYRKFVATSNNIPDYFMLSAWSNRHNLEPLFILMIHRDEMIRIGRCRTQKRALWDRTGLSIYNNWRHVSEFKKYELKEELEILKDLYKDNKNNIN